MIVSGNPQSARRAGRRRLLVALAALSSLVATACGPTVTSTSTTPPPTTATTAPTSTTTTIAPPTTSTTPPSTTTVPTTPSPTLVSTLELGEWDGELLEFGPRNGDGLAVVGVRYNDVLNVREGPGIDFSVVTTLEPDAGGVRALGLTWSNPGSMWYAVDFEGTQGWASSLFLSQPAGTFDFTAQVVEELSGVPSSGSLLQLGRTVAEALASDEPPSRIVQPGPQVVGVLGEVVYDVLGLGDDSVYGFRIRIFATNDQGTWTLSSVQGTVFCLRGVDGDACI